MRILFTNIALNARTGTEILTRDLAVAMRRRGHECVIGTGNLLEDTAAAMPKYDLIFCSGLTAREALSCRRAVICCDNRGLGGMITIQRLKEWGNNLGHKVLTQALTAENLIRELDLYDSSDAAKAAEMFAAGCSITDCAERYESVYQLAMAEGVASQTAAASPDVLEFIETYCQKPGNPRVAAPVPCAASWDAKRPLIEGLQTAFFERLSAAFAK